MGKSVGNLIRGFSTKMTSSFSKKVLIEQGELDLLQQRQLRDYSPELQSMARLQNHIRDRMSRKNLSAEELLTLISGEHIYFDKLTKETGVLSGTLPAQAASAPPLQTPAVLHKVQIEKGIGSDIASENEEENLEEEEEFEEEPAPGSGFSPHLKTLIRWNIDGLYQAKALKLIKRITENKGILDRNESGEAVVYREAIPESNFKSLFTSMVSRRQDLRQVGIEKFLRALRSLGIKKDDLIGETLKYKYTKDAPYEAHHHSTYAPKVTKKSSSTQSSSQGGKGYVHKPPGQHANILYVY